MTWETAGTAGEPAGADCAAVALIAAPDSRASPAAVARTPRLKFGDRNLPQSVETCPDLFGCREVLDYLPCAAVGELPLLAGVAVGVGTGYRVAAARNVAVVDEHEHRWTIQPFSEPAQEAVERAEGDVGLEEPGEHGVEGARN